MHSSATTAAGSSVEAELITIPQVDPHIVQKARKDLEFLVSAQSAILEPSHWANETAYALVSEPLQQMS